MANLDANQNIIIENREKINITGVISVEEFDESTISCVTNKGNISLKGENLHVEKLDLENGELSITGVVYSLDYSDNHQAGGFLARLFR